MSNNELLEQFPTKRVAPFDGMEVTADAWRLAHDYHREMQRFQTLLYHGHGIVQGLEVIASDPPSSVLVIKPGVAVDSEGRTIVIARETPFDIRDEMSGKLYLLLSHKESKARAEGNQSAASDLRYIYEEFTIQILQQIPTGPYIELAQIDRQKRDSEIKNPPHSWRPGLNEINMSYRQKVEQTKATVLDQAPAVVSAKDRDQQALDPAQLKTLQDKQAQLESDLKEILAKQKDVIVELEELKKKLGTLGKPDQGLTASATASETITIGISYLGQANNQRHQRGVASLVRALYPKGTLSHSRPSSQIKIEDNVPLTHPLTGYTLVFLVGEGRFAHNDGKMTTTLYNYLREGGTLFIESCRYQSERVNPSDQSFGNMIRTLGLQLKPLQAPHPLLESPHLFAAPPQGFENRGTPVVQVADGVIWSMSDYACLWQGERRGVAPTREEIRTAIEWGCNIIEYALQRR